MTELQTNLPPGWDCKLDERSGKHYYVNHYTKTTTWEDPRNRHRPLGTPKHLTSIPVEHIPLQEMKSGLRMSPLTLRGSKVQDSTFSTTNSLCGSDSDESVSKISAMFPTVSETHIKILLKNCRYMKSIFPNADETLILDVLQNNDNSIQKTSDILKEMGYSKKETVKNTAPKTEPKTESRAEREEHADPKPKTPTPKIKTKEEKQKMKDELQEKYKDLAEHLITIALESVNFDQNRANQILQIIIQEDSEAGNNHKNDKKQEDSVSLTEAMPSTSNTQPSQIPVSQSRQSLKSILKTEKKDDVIGFSRVLDEPGDNYKSTNLSNTSGHNIDLTRGPNEKLLLENYVQWQGPNKALCKGPQGLAKGPNKNLLSSKIYTTCGPNSEIRKGPRFGLAKGSIFSQLKAVTVGESRVK